MTTTGRPPRADISRVLARHKALRPYLDLCDPPPLLRQLLEEDLPEMIEEIVMQRATLLDLAQQLTDLHDSLKENQPDA